MEQPQNERRAGTVGVIMLLTLLGKVLGLLRDILMGAKFGTGMEANAFLAASRIPRNFFDAIFAAAISASFIPVFSACLEQRGKEEAFRLSNAFLTVVSLAMAALTGLGMVLAPQLTGLLASGFTGETAALCTALLRRLFPTVLFTGIAFSFVGILQSLGEFKVPALLSAISNLVILLYYLVFCDRFGVWGLCAAFLLGWALQALIQLPSLRRKGWRYRPALRHPELRKVFLLMLPVMASTWVQPLNLTVGTAFATHLNEGSAASALEYANTLYTIAAGVFVLSIANVFFPEMSRLSARQDQTAFDTRLRETLSSMLFLLVPMSVGLAAVAEPVVRLLYERGEWTPASTALTAGALRWLSLGMLGYGLQIILSRAYYARQEGKLPLVSGLISAGANCLLCALLAPRLGLNGVAIASAVSALVPALVLLLALQRERRLLGRENLRHFGKLLLAAAAMTGAVLLLLPLTAGLGKLPALLLPVLAGGGVYGLAALLLRVGELQAVLHSIQQRICKGEHPNA